MFEIELVGSGEELAFMGEGEKILLKEGEFREESLIKGIEMPKCEVVWCSTPPMISACVNGRTEIKEIVGKGQVRDMTRIGEVTRRGRCGDMGMREYFEYEAVPIV